MFTNISQDASSVSTIDKFSENTSRNTQTNCNRKILGKSRKCASYFYS